MSSRPQVTITLGRSGQVVKRSADVSNGDYLPSLEEKRPVRERLGSNIDSSHSSSQIKNKRQRTTENSDWNSSNAHFSDEDQLESKRRVSRHDLRFKLISKGLSKRSIAQEKNDVDLREKLSRNTKVSSRFDVRERLPESRSSGLVRRIPPTRSADDLLHLDTLRKPYSSWTFDGARHRSPDRHGPRDRSPDRRGPRHRSPDRDGVRYRSPDRPLGALRGISPPRKYEELRHVSSIRPVASRPTSFLTNGTIDASRPTTFMSKPSVPVEAGKPILRAPPSGATIHKSFYTSEEPLTVAGLLNSLGLGKYAILFQAEEVDMTALKQMGDNDLKELGIPMGPRKKILLAVLSHSKQRHR